MPELTASQKELIGKWELEGSENFDAFLKELGLNAAVRALASKVKPKAIINIEGDAWTIKIETMIRTETVKFKMGEKFEHKTPFGVTVICILEIGEDGRIKETQKIVDGGTKGQKSYVERYVENGKMITLLKTNNVEAKRIYTRLE